MATAVTTPGVTTGVTATSDKVTRLGNTIDTARVTRYVAAYTLIAIYYLAGIVALFAVSIRANIYMMDNVIWGTQLLSRLILLDICAAIMFKSIADELTERTKKFLLNH